MPAPVFAEIGISATLSDEAEMLVESLRKAVETASSELKSPEKSLSAPETANALLTPLFSSSETMKFKVLTLLLTPEMSVLLSKMTSF